MFVKTIVYKMYYNYDGRIDNTLFADACHVQTLIIFSIQFYNFCQKTRVGDIVSLVLYKE